MSIRLFVVDLGQCMTPELRTTLTQSNDVDIIDWVVETESAKQKVQKTSHPPYAPDILLLAADCSDTMLVSQVRYWAHVLDLSKIVLMTDTCSPATLATLLSLNIKGYLFHKIAASDTINALHYVHFGYSQQGHDLIQGAVIEKVIVLSSSSQNEQDHNRLISLSVREREVLQLLVGGESNRVISQRLYISEKTVKNHLTSIFKKLAVTNRTQAAMLAQKNMINGLPLNLVDL